jgi:hypothetical protein
VVTGKRQCVLFFVAFIRECTAAQKCLLRHRPFGRDQRLLLAQATSWLKHLLLFSVRRSPIVGHDQCWKVYVDICRLFGNLLVGFILLMKNIPPMFSGWSSGGDLLFFSPCLFGFRESPKAVSFLASQRRRSNKFSIIFSA